MAYLILAAVLTFAIVLLISLLWFSGRSPESARLMEVTSDSAVPASAPKRWGWIPLPSADQISKVLTPVGSLLGSTKDTAIFRRLTMAGYRLPAHVQIFYGVKALLPILGGVAAFLLVEQDPIFWVILGAALGFLLPDLWLTRAVAVRQGIISRALPDALDLMVICLEAGLGLDQTIVRLGSDLRISHPEMSEELLLVNLQQRAGRGRLEAWRAMADRTGVDSVRQFVHMLAQTERFGTPISRSLSAFADDLRVRRRQKAEEMAAKTTIKLVFPLVLFIFPSLFIVLLGPAVIMIVRNLFKVMGGE